MVSSSDVSLNGVEVDNDGAEVSIDNGVDDAGLFPIHSNSFIWMMFSLVGVCIPARDSLI